MDIIIGLGKGKILLEINSGEKIIDHAEFVGNNNLSVILLEKIDALLEKNNISKKEIRKIFTRSDLPDSYTSARIAEILGKSFNFAVKSK